MLPGTTSPLSSSLVPWKIKPEIETIEKTLQIELVPTGCSHTNQPPLPSADIFGRESHVSSWFSEDEGLGGYYAVCIRQEQTVLMGMSVTPPLSEQLPRTNKFKGEAFGIPTNTRTIYAGSEDDTIKRESRVILLVGPQTAGKSSLIDFLCNYFYGAELEKTTRYHIANEKFDSTTPEKQIITYVFNDTKMDVRPVVIDTPSTSGAHAEENREIMARWLKENEKLKIDAIGVVFSAYQRMTASEEEYLQKALAVFPEHLQSKRIVFITGSDGSSPPVGMLRRFNLDRADVYKVNTSCIFQRPEEDPLQEHLRGNYWRMSIANFGALFSRLKYGDPPSFSTHEYEPPSAMSPSSAQSSTSSQNSVETVIRRIPGGEEVRETQTKTVNGNTVTTTTTKIVTQKSVHTEEDVIVHPPKLVKLDSGSGTTDVRRNGGTQQFETRETAVVDFGGATPETENKNVIYLIEVLLKEANRLGNGAVPVSSRGETKPVTPTSKQTNMSFPHDPPSQIGEGSTVRYVFDVTTRTHLAHDVGVHNGAPQTEAMSIGSTQRKSRETTIDDPYYPPVQQSKAPLSPSRHSWHEIRPDYLGHLPLVQEHYTRTQKETVIDFPSPAAEVSGAFQRHDPTRRGRPSPSPRSRSVDRLDVVSSTVVVGSPGYDPYRQGVAELSYGRTNVDMRQHPEYSLGGRKYDQVPADKYDQTVHGHKYDQVPPEAVTPGANGVMQTEVAQPAYASIHKTTGRTTVQSSEMTMREREEMLRKTRSNVDGASYPGKGRPYYETGAGAAAERNEFMIPEKMRTNKSPIMTGSSPVQYNPSDYGDDWGEETTIIRKVDNSQPRPQLIEERYRYRHYGGQKDEDPAKDRPTSAAPPPYVEYGTGETHPLKEGKGVLTTTKKTTTTTRKQRTLQ
ncbi:hypothetical protein ANCCEY_06533 [Ancylostoma ceylanicum]|uniref:Uncharacterized protein n=1 Tax=Ancylostoma ceylanicum TaxID=53326 RepID=A0A0D6LR77_9BILA|nr:hypothetical protein ANCCEY_06533 [Ancylostoma ceylanicum]